MLVFVNARRSFHCGLNPRAEAHHTTPVAAGTQPHHLIRIQSFISSTVMASEKRRLDPPCADRGARKGQQLGRDRGGLPEH